MKSALILCPLLCVACYESHGLGQPQAGDDSFDIPELEAAQSSDVYTNKPVQQPVSEPEFATTDIYAVALTDDVTHCASGKSFTKRLDTSSTRSALGASANWYFDAYVFTAQVNGTVSIWSQTRGVGDSYAYGYAYPLSGQLAPEGVSAPEPRSVELVSSLPDNAGGDGSARLDLLVEKGKRYIVAYKGLTGPATTQAEWDYDLSFCADQLGLEGKLWDE